MSTSPEVPRGINSKEGLNIEGYQLPDLNNFFCHFPGGRYRNGNYPGFKKLQDDLDVEAQRLGINTEALFQEMRQGLDKVMEAIKIMQAQGGYDSPEVRRIAEEGEIIKKAATQKMLPLFKALMARGYNPNTLAR